MLILTTKGLYCPAGDFYIDPKGAVPHAVITHAHSDHARRGSKNYYVVASGVSLLKIRLGQNISVQSFAYAQPFQFNDVTVSFHPAGHILGSSQVRIEFNGEVWVVSGDYKREPDTTCELFKTVTCDVFITEATFGTPAYVWDKNIDFGEEIFEWWQQNANEGFNSVLLAYSLGKSQRILGSLYSHTDMPIICHTTTEEINDAYRREDIDLAPSAAINTLNQNKKIKGALFLVPPAALKSSFANVIGNRYKIAFASGWMARENHYYDRGFLMSDHADWHDLITTILESKAKKIYIQHRGVGALQKELKSLGLDAEPDTKLMPINDKQLSFI